MDTTRSNPAAERRDDAHVATSLRRVIVERMQPEIDAGRFPVKRTVGESVRVSADIFADGHDLLAGVVKYRLVRAGSDRSTPRPPAADPALWNEIALIDLGDDRWGASFTVGEMGTYEYTIEAWIDRFATWLRALASKLETGRDVSSELLEGADLVQAAAMRAESRSDEARLTRDEDLLLLECADYLRSGRSQRSRAWAARDPELKALMDARPDRGAATTYERTLRVIVERLRARFGAWYEMFPRSCTDSPGRSGTLREAEARLPAIADMGFDVLYLPPIHPIGRTHRKGRNNTLTPAASDPGSPWAIGAEEGGHLAIEPGLGNLEDFDRFVAVANRLGLDVALDIAFQTSPDHPWVHEHPQWFRHRPDGSIKHAENPPKQYQDIYPLDFESTDWRALWAALRDVLLFWMGHGVTIFRVDNPHTKTFAFWEWVIDEVKRAHPEAIFLAEAFTKPKVMRYLAKVGFTQSYTYFTWRNTAHELRDYLSELTHSELQEYMRPNFFANTPDILSEYLQHGGRAAFEVRLILAATLAASYGIYSGFELCENLPARPGSEEYLDSEKYQLKLRDWNQPSSLRELIARVNAIRHAHPALQQNATLVFHATDNPAFLWFSKTAADDRVFVVANTDPSWTQQGWVQMPIWELGIDPRSLYTVEDLMDGARYTWRGEWNYVKLDSRQRVAHIFAVRSA